MADSEMSIRGSQLITTYGIGAIVPVKDTAVMVQDIDLWDVGGPDLFEPRLERALNSSGYVLEGFLRPPPSESGSQVPVVRFPQWCWCPACRQLDKHSKITMMKRDECPDCNEVLVPSRFVVACPAGHIDDFPYLRWVHEGAPPPGKDHHLKMKSPGTAASLAGVEIECSCGAERSMEEAFDASALLAVSHCWGTKPWASADDESCSQQLRTLQRGASGVWFGHTKSALSIPPWSEGVSMALDPYWNVLRLVPDSPDLLKIVESLRLPKKTGYGAAEIVETLKQRRGQEDGQQGEDIDLRSAEYDALIRGREDESEEVDFSTRPGIVPPDMTEFVSQVQLVTRLREVRALLGFSRIKPPTTGAGEDPPNIQRLGDGDEETYWLPAIEVKGEGLFMRLDQERLDRWSEMPGVAERVAAIVQSAQHHSSMASALEIEVVSPQSVLLHTLAHVLILQLSLDAGYPAASLRERLFADEGQAGILIYTATTDSAGSMGGILSRGEEESFRSLFLEAVSAATWCSADPVCIESEAAGVDSLNLAACHNCCLVPETSCENLNSYLDRALLVGWPGHENAGFFSSFLA